MTHNSILVLNTGSSSVKFALYDADDLSPLLRGVIDESGPAPTIHATGREAPALLDNTILAGGGHAVQIGWLLKRLVERLPHISLVAAGHRVVHGGRDFTTPVMITDNVVEKLQALVPLAPAHQPHNLSGIAAVTASWPDLPQIACFDTAFHRTQPRLARLFPLPRQMADEGIERYGFHGLSYQHISEVLPHIAGARAMGRVIVAHLGNGASMCAMHNGQSIATTMGMTALDGLMMGTRSGAIDPGLVLHLIQQLGMSPEEVSNLLGKQAGLLGVSGISGDVRTLEASDDPHAEEALNLFAYRAVRECGSLMSALGGLDLLIFTGGIGEHSVQMRQRICNGLKWAGADLDQHANAASDVIISSDASTVGLYVIPANEELPIARAAQHLLTCGL